jgi:hypothetical protein
MSVAELAAKLERDIKTVEEISQGNAEKKEYPDIQIAPWSHALFSLEGPPEPLPADPDADLDLPQIVAGGERGISAEDAAQYEASKEDRRKLKRRIVHEMHRVSAATEDDPYQILSVERSNENYESRVQLLKMILDPKVNRFVRAEEVFKSKCSHSSKFDIASACVSDGSWQGSPMRTG